MGGREGSGGGSGWWGVRVDVNEELKFFVKIQKGGDRGGGGWVGGGGSGLGGGGQGGCERRIEVLGKLTKIKISGNGVRWGRVGGGQGRCERNVGGRG